MFTTKKSKVTFFVIVINFAIENYLIILSISCSKLTICPLKYKESTRVTSTVNCGIVTYKFA